MNPIQVGERAPAVPGVPFGDGPVGLFFYKVTCPTCQLAAPTLGTFVHAYPERVLGIGQDPQDLLDAVGEVHGMGIRSVEDRPPYDLSTAYRVVSVPTLVVVDEAGAVVESVEAWDRDGFNRASARIAEALGVDPVAVSEPGDGRPDFKPG